MSTGTAVGLIVGSYFFGAVSSSLLIVRALRGIDVRTVGSGNAGATNVLRVAGRAPALAVLVLDLGKGVVTVAAARWLDAPGPVLGTVAVATVVGHVYPIYHGFRGGKGVATVAGAVGSLALLPAALSAVVFAIVVALTRYVALGSAGAIVLFPALAYLCGRRGWTAPAPAWLLLSTGLVALLIVLKHSDNWRRLRDGTEWKIGDPRGKDPRDGEEATA